MGKRISIVQYWGGCPSMANSKWHSYVRLTQACAERGWSTVMVWSALPADDLARPFRDAGCEIVFIPRPRRNFDPACIYRTYRLCRRTRCDILHCYNVHTSPTLGAVLAGVPVRIWSKLSMSREYEEGRTPLGIHRLHPSTRVCAALSNQILCVSSTVADELAVQGVSREKLQLDPRLIHFEAFANASSHGVRESLGISEEAFLITTVGHAVSVKGWDILIRALARVPEISNARLLLVGSIDSAWEVQTAHALRALVGELALSDRVRFTGQRSDVAAILRASNVFVLPSRSEGLPGSLLEAMAAGLPCVAARVGGIPDILKHNENGLLFEKEGVADLAECIRSVARDAEFRRRLGAAAQEAARSFDLESTISRLPRLYEDLLCRFTATPRTSLSSAALEIK